MLINYAEGNGNDDNDDGGVEGNCEMTTMVMTMIALTTTMVPAGAASISSCLHRVINYLLTSVGRVLEATTSMALDCWVLRDDTHHQCRDRQLYRLEEQAALLVRWSVA